MSREPWSPCVLCHWPDLPHTRGGDWVWAFYKAAFDRSGLQWRSASTQPRWAARYLLDVVSVTEDRCGSLPGAASRWLIEFRIVGEK